VIIIEAEPSDLPRLLRFRTDTAAWLAPQGIDQWSNPFPPEHILASVEAGEVFLIKESPGAEALATITLDQEADTRIWTVEEREESARYVHKLTVDRSVAGAGLGVRILDWAGDRAAREGAKWLRLDAWTTNPRLHKYYLRQGFRHVRTSPDPKVVSGWAAQRPACRNSTHGLKEVVGDR
jgi:GNAT superfamily N-acetyltransferase